MLYVVTIEEQTDGGNFYYDAQRVTAVLHGPDHVDINALRREFRCNLQRPLSDEADASAFVDWLCTRIPDMRASEYQMVTIALC